MNGDESLPDYLQKSTRRRLLSLSAGALATGIAGCSAVNLSGTSGLSSPDKTALEEYSDSYETVQGAKEKYEDGIETFRKDLGPDGRIKGEYPADFPELQERMLRASEEFSDASGGFSQASRSASSPIIESGCDIAVEWVEPHIEVAEFFGDLGGPSKEFVDNSERKISNRPAPLDPETLRERAVNGEGLNVTPSGTPETTSTPVTTATSSTPHEQAEDPFRERRQTENALTTTLSFEVVLEAGQYAHRELRIEEPSEVEVTGESTARMDVFLLSPESVFAKYQAGESTILSGGLTKTNINSINETVEVSSGQYFLVFDNTATYGTEPQGKLTSRFEVTISPGQSTPTGTETPTPTPTETSTPTPTETSTSTPEPSPNQPKIREVKDNFGHTFTIEGDSGAQPNVDDEIVVDDDTSVELCVTEIDKQDVDEIAFDYWFGNTRSAHPENPEGWNNSSCWNWDMGRDYYSSHWGFSIWIRNQDDIYYQNRSKESDFRVVIHYTNLTLADE